MEDSLRTVDKFPRKKVATSIYQSRAFRKRAKIRNPPLLIYPRLPLTDFPTRVSRENFQTNVARQGIVGLDFYRRNARVLNRPRFVPRGLYRDISRRLFLRFKREEFGTWEVFYGGSQSRKFGSEILDGRDWIFYRRLCDSFVDRYLWIVINFAGMRVCFNLFPKFSFFVASFSK